MRFFAAICGASLLAACTSSAPPSRLPELSQETLLLQADRLDDAGEVAQTSLLTIQRITPQQTRWILTDAFGAPQARVLLSPQGWQRDGFVPPNRSAQQLFQQLAPHICPQCRLPDTVNTTTAQWHISPTQ